jgi:hypothetical protein
MMSRTTLIAVLVVLELAIIGEMFVAFRGDQPTPWSAQQAFAQGLSGTRVVEGGPHQLFDVGAHPALTVDIGYADLTIQTSSAPQIDVSVSKSFDFGPFRNNQPITAQKNGETVHIAAADPSGFTMGDNRMVTVLVPAGTQVTVVAAGDITATGLRAEASFNSVGNGSVTLEDFNAPALHVTSSDGRITLRQIATARLDVRSDDGRVEGSGLQLRDGSVESHDGRVNLAFAPGSNTVIHAEASDGKIRVSGLSTVGPAQTSKSDDDDDSDANTQTVRIGDGDGRLDVRANDGNINLSQEG